ncbi:MAG: hypothetical protein AB1757_21485 [Acidobacteriota bacterium]
MRRIFGEVSMLESEHLKHLIYFPDNARLLIQAGISSCQSHYSLQVLFRFKGLDSVHFYLNEKIHEEFYEHLRISGLSNWQEVTGLVSELAQIIQKEESESESFTTAHFYAEVKWEYHHSTKEVGAVSYDTHSVDILDKLEGLREEGGNLSEIKLLEKQLEAGWHQKAIVILHLLERFVKSKKTYA